MRTAFKALELKASKEARTLEGYASTWDIDRGDDQFVPGAFTESIERIEKKSVLLWQHKKDHPLGISEELHEDSSGVYFKDRIANTREADEALELVEMKAVTGVSVGWSLAARPQFVNVGSRRIRRIEKANLGEHSLVTFPMNDGARITAFQKTLTDAEDIMVARRQAKEFLKALGGGISGIVNAVLQNAGDNREQITAAIMSSTGMNQGQLQDLVNGNPKCPVKETVVLLAKAIGVDEDELLAVGVEDGCDYSLADGVATNDDALVEEELGGEEQKKLAECILAFCGDAGRFVRKLEGLTPRAR